MAFLQRKTEVSATASLYTLDLKRTCLIIGLGNPGKAHRGSRHNIGFDVLDDFALKNEFPNWRAIADLKCDISSSVIDNVKVILCKPSTFMNESGQAARAVQHYFKVSNAHTLVVYDELALPFGQIRTRVGGSDGGHNGVKSLINHIGEDFVRLRIGIGKLPMASDSAKFVLAKFSAEEKRALPEIIKEVSAMVTEYVYGGQLPHETRSILI